MRRQKVSKAACIEYLEYYAAGAMTAAEFKEVTGLTVEQVSSWE